MELNNCGLWACRISFWRLMGKWREKLLNGASYGGKTGPDDWIKKAVERELSCLASSFLIRYRTALPLTSLFYTILFFPVPCPVLHFLCLINLSAERNRSGYLTHHERKRYISTETSLPQPAKPLNYLITSIIHKPI